MAYTKNLVLHIVLLSIIVTWTLAWSIKSEDNINYGLDQQDFVLRRLVDALTNNDELNFGRRDRDASCTCGACYRNGQYRRCRTVLSYNPTKCDSSANGCS